MKLGWVGAALSFGAFIVGCGAGNNGGWVTKGGYATPVTAPAAQANPACPACEQAPAAKEAAVSPITSNLTLPSAIRVLDLDDPWGHPPPPRERLTIDKKSPYDGAGSESGDDSKAAKQGQPNKAQEPGF